MKGADVVVEGGARPPEAQQQTGHLSGTPLDALARLTFLTASEAADFLRKPSVSAFRQWAYDARLPRCRAGRSVLYRRRDLEAAVDPQSKRFASHREAS